MTERNPAPQYRLKFDETGGYDCMTAAFSIHAPDGTLLCEVDARNFGQEPCDYEDTKSIETAKAIAQGIVFALNYSLLAATPNRAYVVLDSIQAIACIALESRSKDVGDWADDMVRIRNEALAEMRNEQRNGE